MCAEFERTIRTQFVDYAAAQRLTPMNVFDVVASTDGFDSRLSRLLGELLHLTGNVVLSNAQRRSIEMFKSMAAEGSFRSEQWEELVTFISTQVPVVVQHLQPQTPLNCSLYLLKLLGDNNDSALEPLRLLLAVIEAYRKNATGVVSLVLDNVEVLLRSSSMQPQATVLFSDLIGCLLSVVDIPTVAICGDSLAAVRGVYLQRNSQREELASRPDPMRLVEVVELSGWTKDVVRQVLMPRFTSEEQIFLGIWTAVGGHCGMLRQIAIPLAERTAKLSNDLEREKTKTGQTGPVDDGEFSELKLSATEEERNNQKLLDHQKQFLRSIPQQMLPHEVRAFEYKMITFMSLPLMLSLKEQINNHIHFLVTVLESIREIVRRGSVRCNPLKIDHTVLLCLLDANLLTLRLSDPCCLEIPNAFTKHLLTSFVNHKYGGLAFSDRLEYNLNYLTNRSALLDNINRLQPNSYTATD
eukprot:GHVS01036916.1.p1 GENE.GHVS01036916.1~~GHVS01036916.1.p1  ORF type:complete len:469 (+),score=72.22 GHVS01036916.1:448-1854(+)